MKTALVCFVLGMGQGMILLDWYRDKQLLTKKVSTNVKRHRG